MFILFGIICFSLFDGVALYDMIVISNKFAKYHYGVYMATLPTQLDDFIFKETCVKNYQQLDDIWKNMKLTPIGFIARKIWPRNQLTLCSEECEWVVNYNKSIDVVDTIKCRIFAIVWKLNYSKNTINC